MNNTCSCCRCPPGSSSAKMLYALILHQLGHLMALPKICVFHQTRCVGRSGCSSTCGKGYIAYTTTFKLYLNYTFKMTLGNRVSDVLPPVCLLPCSQTQYIAAGYHVQLVPLMTSQKIKNISISI